MLELPVIADAPDVVRRQGYHCIQELVGSASIRHQAPAGAVPVIRHRHVPVTAEVRELVVADSPQVIRRGARQPSQDNKAVLCWGQWERHVAPGARHSNAG